MCISLFFLFPFSFTNHEKKDKNKVLIIIKFDKSILVGHYLYNTKYYLLYLTNNCLLYLLVYLCASTIILSAVSFDIKSLLYFWNKL